MGIFKKTIKYSKPSKDLDAKIKNLDEKLKQTGVIEKKNDAEESFVESLPIVYDKLKIKKEENLYNWRESFYEKKIDDFFIDQNKDFHKNLDSTDITLT